MTLSLKTLLSSVTMMLASILPMTGYATHHSHSSDSCSDSSSESSEHIGRWEPLVNQPNFISGENYPGGANNPILLTDGSVIVQNNGYFATGEIWKLTPDKHGSYVHGTWSQLASLPDGYIPTYFASAVLADGRVIFIGGEYTGPYYDFTLTNQGAIYDPVSNVWTSVEGPSFFENFYPTWYGNNSEHPVGDAASVILEDGTFMLQSKMCKMAALWNPKDSYMPVWRETGTATKQYMNTEEGWTLLPSGEVLTINTYKEYMINHQVGENSFPYPYDLTQSEIYNPKTGEWSYGGSTIFPLSDTSIIGSVNVPSAFEIGAAVLRPDGTVFCVGGNGNNAIYDTKTKHWHQGPRLPSLPDPQFQLGTQDGPGALLPNGNVLFAVSPIFPNYSSPTHFFEFDGSKLIEQPTTPNAIYEPAYASQLLVLPTGQVMLCDFSNDVEIYTPSNKRYNSEWAPEIKSVPDTVHVKGTYKIKGIRFNGMSQAGAYGNDYQMATNYPLVRITNEKTGHVFYCRTHDHSYMGVASDKEVYTYFDVPAEIECGKSKLEVVANGIPSKSVYINVKSH